MFVGIDLGQRRRHLVALDEELRLVRAAVVDVADLDSLSGELEAWTRRSRHWSRAGVGQGRAVPVGCGHDPSAIWLPDPR